MSASAAIPDVDVYDATSDDDSDTMVSNMAMLDTANQLMRVSGADPSRRIATVAGLQASASSLFVAVFEALFQMELANVKRESLSGDDLAANAQEVIHTTRSLLQPTTRIPDFVTGEAIRNGDLEAIRFMLVLFASLDANLEAARDDMHNRETAPELHPITEDHSEPHAAEILDIPTRAHQASRRTAHVRESSTSRGISPASEGAATSRTSADGRPMTAVGRRRGDPLPTDGLGQPRTDDRATTDDDHAHQLQHGRATTDDDHAHQPQHGRATTDDDHAHQLQHGRATGQLWQVPSFQGADAADWSDNEGTHDDGYDDDGKVDEAAVGASDYDSGRVDSGSPSRSGSADDSGHVDSGSPSRSGSAYDRAILSPEGVDLWAEASGSGSKHISRRDMIETGDSAWGQDPQQAATTMPNDHGDDDGVLQMKPRLLAHPGENEVDLVVEDIEDDEGPEADAAYWRRGGDDSARVSSASAGPHPDGVEWDEHTGSPTTHERPPTGSRSSGGGQVTRGGTGHLHDVLKDLPEASRALVRRTVQTRSEEMRRLRVAHASAARHRLAANNRSAILMHRAAGLRRRAAEKERQHQRIQTQRMLDSVARGMASRQVARDSKHELLVMQLSKQLATEQRAAAAERSRATAAAARAAAYATATTVAQARDAALMRDAFAAELLEGEQGERAAVAAGMRETLLRGLGEMRAAEAAAEEEGRVAAEAAEAAWQAVALDSLDVRPGTGRMGLPQDTTRALQQALAATHASAAAGSSAARRPRDDGEGASAAAGGGEDEMVAAMLMAAQEAADEAVARALGAASAGNTFPNEQPVRSTRRGAARPKRHKSKSQSGRARTGGSRSRVTGAKKSAGRRTRRSTANRTSDPRGSGGAWVAPMDRLGWNGRGATFSNGIMGGGGSPRRGTFA